MPISETDKAQIEKLREFVKDEISPYYDTDFNLLRWLKGHDYNFDLIVPKLKNHLLFRRSSWDLDNLASKPRNHAVHRHWKSGLTGESGVRQNVIVNIEQTGSNDYWGMLATHPINEILKARVHDLESMLRAVMELEKKTGEQCSVMYFMDLTGLKMDRRVTTLISGALASISAFMAEHYVEMIHSFVLVNVPTFISAIWTVARPLLPEKTKNKVNILGGNWREEVIKLANPEVLPAYWNLPGEEEPFSASVEKCIPFPEEEYFKGTISEKSQLLSVPAGKSGYFDVDVAEGESLKWEIHADGHFAFVICKVGDDQDADVGTMERAYPSLAKVPGPTMVPILDELKDPAPGTYRFVFGNQHAWFHKLNVNYLINTKAN